MEHWLARLKEWAPLASFVLVFGAAIAVLQLRLARRQFAAAHRPELTVPACDVVWRSPPVAGIPDDARGLGARFALFNSGARPARKVAVRAAILLTDPQNVGDYLLDIRAPRRLAAGRRIELAVFVDPRADGFVPHASTPVRCIARIAYRDSAGRKRETGFARRFDAVGKRWVREDGSQHDYAY